jgi:hypothetical protein
LNEKKKRKKKEMIIGLGQRRRLESAWNGKEYLRTTRQIVRGRQQTVLEARKRKKKKKERKKETKKNRLAQIWRDDDEINKISQTNPISPRNRDEYQSNGL